VKSCGSTSANDKGLQTVRVTIRLAQPDDAEAIAATLRLAFAEFASLYTRAAFSATTPSVDEIAERFTEGPIWVAELANTVVGTISAVSHGSELYIRSMAVRPDARGSGVGRQLLDTVEAFATEHKYGRLFLNTTPFLLSAIRLYERYGFRYTGEEPDLFGTRLLTMAKALRLD
jgi:ribosomal protein S18 acetylase RimI-like enzyme